MKSHMDIHGVVHLIVIQKQMILDAYREATTYLQLELSYAHMSAGIRTAFHLALPAPADGGARPLPFFERVGGAAFEAGPAVTGRVEVEMRAGETCRGAARSIGTMAAAFLLPLERAGSASTCISSVSLAATAAGVLSTSGAAFFVVARLLGRCASRIIFVIRS